MKRHKLLLAVLTLTNIALFSLNGGNLNASKLRTQHSLLQRSVLKNKTFRGLVCIAGTFICLYLAAKQASVKKPDFTTEDFKCLQTLVSEADNKGALSQEKKEIMEELLKKADAFSKSNPTSYKAIEADIENARATLGLL